MAKWVSANVLDNGLNYIKNNATKMHLIKNYNANDSYATVLSNDLGSANMISSDFTLGTSGSNRNLTTATSKTATAIANSGISPDLHFAFTNGSSEVIWVTDETSNQVITSGNTLNFPSLIYTSNQPT